MTAQAPARGITDAQFFDQGGIVQSALFQIVQRLWVAHRVAVDRKWRFARARRQDRLKQPLLLEVSETLAERQMARQLDKAKQIAALAATVTVEEIFASVDIERRAGLPMQGTEADELGAMTCRSRDPVLLPQIIKQRKALFEFFEIFAHGAFASGGEA